MDKRALLEEWFQRFWVQEDMTAIEDMTVPDAPVLGLTDAPQITPEELRGFAQSLLALCNFDRIEIEKYTEDGDWAHVLTTFHATARNGGAPCPFTAQILVRIEGGRIVEGHNHPDFITLFQQLGIMPSDMLTRCLSANPGALA